MQSPVFIDSFEELFKGTSTKSVGRRCKHVSIVYSWKLEPPVYSEVLFRSFIQKSQYTHKSIQVHGILHIECCELVEHELVEHERWRINMATLLC